VLEEYSLPPADIYAVYPERHNLSAKVRVFVDYLVEQFKEKKGGTLEAQSKW